MTRTMNALTVTTALLDLTEVRDVEGYVYPLSTRIGQGGQGVVYDAVNGWMAVKLFRTGRGAATEALRERIAAVRRLPIEDLLIARPIATLAPPHTGYVMRLMTGMVPISRLMRPDRSATSVRTWYLDTGGLRRRLVVLERLARTLAELHALGLTYGDPSPNNLLVSADTIADEVRLIDADNLQTPEAAAASRLYTPSFGAPELVRGETGNSFASDVWSLLVIAFQVLVLNHPLVGEFVDQGDPDVEDAAFRGELPWIDDPTDTTNRARPNAAMSREVVLSPGLRRLFEACFGAGRTSPAARPSAAEATVAFTRAARMTVTCSGCQSGYYVSAATCPWCGTRRPQAVILSLHRWDGEADDPVRGAVGRSTTVVLDPAAPCRVSSALFGIDEDDPAVGFACLLELTDRGIKVRAADGGTYEVRSPDGLTERSVPPSGMLLPLPEPGSASWRIHTGPLARPHVFCTFQALEGGYAAR
jgi:eukaryotic-like serine/threonine-protein kinase